MKKILKDKRNILLLVIVAIGLTIIIGCISYAFIKYNTNQEEINVVGTDCIKLEMEELTDGIELQHARPVTDEVGASANPYSFKLTNTCDKDIAYDVNLDILNTDNRIDSKNIAIIFNDDEKVLLNTYPTTDITNRSAVESRNLYSKTLAPNESVTHYLKLWLDKSAGNETQNGTFFSKIMITTASYGEKTPVEQTNTIMAYKENTAFWSYRENITKVIIQNEMKYIENPAYTFDVSEEQDESVMAYLVANQSDASTYTLYLQGKNGIVANPNSGAAFAYFAKLESIEGLEYLDTSNVTSMNSMFFHCENLKSLDLSHFNTSKVTNMYGMFWESSKLTNLNISSFDTSNVTNMNDMFKGLSSTVKVFVRNASEQQKMLASSNRPTSWTTSNVIVES